MTRFNGCAEVSVLSSICSCSPLGSMDPVATFSLAGGDRKEFVSGLNGAGVRLLNRQREVVEAERSAYRELAESMRVHGESIRNFTEAELAREEAHSIDEVIEHISDCCAAQCFGNRCPHRTIAPMALLCGLTVSTVLGRDSEGRKLAIN